MKIGIDGRPLEEKRTGVGRYLESILREWSVTACGDSLIIYYLNEAPADRFLRVPYMELRKISFEEAGQADAFSAELKRNPVDVFFSPFYDLPRSLQCPAVITVHDLIHQAFPSSFDTIQREYLCTAHDYSLQRADEIITDSLFSQSEIALYYPGAAHRITVIPLAPSPLFRARVLEDSFPEQPFGIRRPFIFQAGSITPKRHVIPLLEAFLKIHRDFKEWSVMVVGKNVTFPRTDIDGAVAAYNRRMGRKAVFYHHYVGDGDLVKLYNAAALCAYLSSYEGFGMPPLEAMACGTPVLTTACTSLPEVTGDAALTVDPADIDDIAAGLRRLMESETERNEMRRRGFARALQFSWTSTAEKTLEIIHRCGGR